MALSCGVVCVILRIAVLIQYRSVADTQTHRHTTTANTALSIASRGKKRNISPTVWAILLKLGQVMHLGLPDPAGLIKFHDFKNAKMAYDRHLQKWLKLFDRLRATRCHGNVPWDITNFVKNGKFPSFVALAFRNIMGYRYLNVPINSVNDACISCENFVNFSRVTQELQSLFVNVWYDTAKNLGI